MIKRKILSCILFFSLISSMLVPICCATDQLNETDRVPAPPALSIDAKAAYLIDTTTGDVLYSMNENDQLYPASTTKIMTCYLTLKYGNVNDMFTLPDGIASGMDDSASTSNLEPGEELYISELLQCLMISSANEAANALAIYISGSIDKFVELMNEEATELGCRNTHFENPNGLHSDNHYTSAADLSLITLAALQYDTFRDLCGISTATIRETNLSDERTLDSTNYLLPGTDFPAYDYDGAEGVKTGHTTPAGYCLVSMAKRDDCELLGVVLGASKSETDDQVEIGSFTESIKLLDWGFENHDTAIFYQQYLLDDGTDAKEESISETDQSETAESALDGKSEIEEPDSATDSVAEPAGEEASDPEVVEEEVPVSSPAAGKAQSAASSDNFAVLSGNGITAYTIIKLQQFSDSLKISSIDLVLLLAGCLFLIVLSLLILICCCIRRKQVKKHAI